MNIIVLLIVAELALCQHNKNGVGMDFQNLNIINHTNDTFSNVDGRIKKFNHTAYVIELELDVNKALGDSVSISFTYFALQGNEYRAIFQNKVNEFCEYIQSDQLFYEALLKNSNLPPRGQCPIPAQHISVLPHEAALAEIPAIFLTAPNWKLLVQLYDKQILQLELELYFTITKY